MSKSPSLTLAERRKDRPLRSHLKGPNIKGFSLSPLPKDAGSSSVNCFNLRLCNKILSYRCFSPTVLMIRSV